VVGGGGGKYPYLAAIHLSVGDQFVADAGMEHAGIYPASLNPGGGGVMGAGIADAAEEALRLDAVLQHEVARHQTAGGRGDRAEGKGLALEVSQGIHLGVGGDEVADELGVLLALNQRNGIAGL